MTIKYLPGRAALLLSALLTTAAHAQTRVGVGTPNPTETLDVNGQLRVRNLALSAAAEGPLPLQFTADGTLVPLSLYNAPTTGTAPLIVDGDGAPGQLPSAGLSLSGGHLLTLAGSNSVWLSDYMGNHTATQSLRLPDYDLLLRSGTDLTSGLGHYAQATAMRNWAGLLINGPVLYGAGGGLLGSYDGTTRTNALRWTSVGNVGVGTASPNTRLDVDGGLSLRPSAAIIAIVNNNQAVSVGDRSYLRLTCSNPFIPLQVTLGAGSQPGQLLTVHNVGSTGMFFFADSGNMNLPGNWVLGPTDSAQLLWNGTTWLGVSSSSNSN